MTTEVPNLSLIQRGKERLNDPKNAFMLVTSIRDVPGYTHNITVVRDPYHPALGGLREADATRLLSDYENADPIYTKRIMEGRSVSSDIAAAGLLESFQLGGEMAVKHAGEVATMREGMDNHPEVYGDYRGEILGNRDAWLDAAKMFGGTKGIMVRNHPGAYAALTPQQQDRLWEQRAEHVIKLNEMKPTDDPRVVYYTAPDSGTDSDKMSRIRDYTGGKFVACYRVDEGGTGNPSPTTALSVAYSTKALLHELGLNQDGTDVSFGIQGAAGEVGSVLVGLYYKNHPRAELIITDMDRRRDELERLSDQYGANIVRPNDIFESGIIFVPSGPPGQLNDRTRLLMVGAGVKGVSGPANYNWTAGHEKRLAEEFRMGGITVDPAELGNQGGIRSILPQFIEDITGRRPSQEAAHQSVVDVEPMTRSVLEEARQRGVTPDQAFHERAIFEYATQCRELGLL